VGTFPRRESAGLISRRTAGHLSSRGYDEKGKASLGREENYEGVAGTSGVAWPRANSGAGAPKARVEIFREGTRAYVPGNAVKGKVAIKGLIIAVITQRRAVSGQPVTLLPLCPATQLLLGGWVGARGWSETERRERREGLGRRSPVSPGLARVPTDATARLSPMDARFFQILLVP
jgi:hypothetical protein